MYEESEMNKKSAYLRAVNSAKSRDELVAIILSLLFELYGD